MRALRLILLLVLALVVIYQKTPTTCYRPFADRLAANTNPETTSSLSTSSDKASGIPDKAYFVFNYVRDHGRAPEGYVGGRVFQNREGRLPAVGDYREFDVDPKPRSGEGGRNAERLIIDWSSPRAWYTPDHYRTFIPIS